MPLRRPSGNSAISPIRRRTASLLFCLCAWLGLVAASQAAGIDVYIMAGQSNMVGGNTATLPAGLNPQSDVLYQYLLHTSSPDIQSTSWGPLRSLAGVAPAAAYASDLSFAHAMKTRTGNKVAIIKVAANATSLALNWDPETGTHVYTPGGLYDWMINKVNSSMSQLVDLGYQPHVAGFVWVQGEGDSSSPNDSANYNENLADFSQAIRTDLGVPEMPFLYNQLHASLLVTGGNQYKWRDTVRASQAEADALPNMFMVNADDLQLGPDSVHFTSNMHVELGRRFADVLAPSADFNYDGVVDVADKLIWQQSTSVNRVGDGNSDGVTDGADFLLWQRQSVASSSPTVSSVPEPAAGLLAFIGAGIASFAIRSRRRIRCAAMGLAAITTLPAPAFAQPARPNIIMLLADDLGWTETSVQMHPDIPESKSDYYQTPNIAALANQGMKFSSAYSAPLCTSTRAALITGKSPAQLQMTDVVSGPALDATRYQGGGTSFPLATPIVRPALPKSETTIAEYLHTNAPGYKAANFGKWHLSLPENGLNAMQPGYEFDAEHIGQWGLSADQDPKGNFSANLAGMRFMEQRVAANTPFYLQMSYTLPHAPFESRPQTLAKYQALPPGERHYLPQQAAMIDDLDTLVGQIMAKVNQLGIADNTYIVFTSDNNSHEGLAPEENSPLFHFKGSVYEGGTRVPMIVAGPGISSNVNSTVPVMVQDVFATVSSVAGVTQPLAGNIESADLLPLLHNGGALPQGTAALSRGFAPNGEIFTHMPHYTGAGRVPASSVLDGDFKLVKVYGENGHPDKVMLFNLAQNITESDNPASPLNLASQYPEKTSQLLAKLDKWLVDTDASLPYDISKPYNQHWVATQSGVDATAWRSVTDVNSYGRERFEFDAATAPSKVTVAPYQPGLGSTAFRFDGTDGMRREFFRVSDNRTTADKDADRSASFSMWVRTDSLNSNQVLFESGDGVAGLSLTLGDANGDGQANEMRFRVLGGGNTSLTVTAPIDQFVDPTKDFFQASAVFSDNPNDRFVEIFVNGTSVGRVQGVAGANKTIYWDKQNLSWIGFNEAGVGDAGGAVGGNGGTDAAKPFIGKLKGEISRFSFSNYALTRADVLSSYNAQLSPVSWGLDSLNGQASTAAFRPNSVALGVAESDKLMVIHERNDVLDAPLSVDAVVASGAGGVAPGSGTLPQLPAGTEFTSYLLHYDPVGTAAGSSSVTGTVKFDENIIAVILGSQQLVLSDKTLGSIGNYGAAGPRGVTFASGDFISIGQDQKTLNFSLQTASSDLLQFRVLTDLATTSGPPIDPSPSADADFNDDGFVNATDLLVWKSSFGMNAGADADGDGDSDGADFLAWQGAFQVNSAAPLAAAVPEPAANVLIMSACLGWILSRRRAAA